MAATADAELLRSTDEVEAFAAQARTEGAVALDTEFHWERTYAPVLCLAQAATRERIVLVDPLEGGDVGPLAALVRDPSVEVVMHAPSGDILLFALREHALATGVFDTQIAAGFCGFGASASLERLLSGALGVKLAHHESFSDWRRRPLTPTQLAYAADDVRYLLPLADRLRERLRDAGRSDWVADELHRRFGDPDAIVADPENAWLKVGRRGRLSPRQLAVLRALAAWREREARRRDLPVGWLIKDQSLVELARVGPGDVEAARRVRGVGALKGDLAAGVVEAVARGRELEPPPGAREVSVELQRRADAWAGLAGVLLRARAESGEVAPELVATRASIESFARAAAEGDVGNHPLASGWRARLIGDDLRGLLEGRLGMRAADAPPYVSVEPVEGRW